MVLYMCRGSELTQLAVAADVEAKRLASSDTILSGLVKELATYYLLLTTYYYLLLT